MSLSYLLFLTFNLRFLKNEAIVDVTFFVFVHLSPYIDLEGFRSPLALVLFKFVFIDPILSCEQLLIELVEFMTLREY